MTTAELDSCRWWDSIKPNLGSVDASSARSAGRRLGKGIKEYIQREGIQLTRNRSYLGLAAGQAYSELTFASTLGVKPENITLVDRGFSSYTRRHISRKIQLVESGLFAFLEDPNNSGFTFISAFGIEYVLSDEPKIDALITQTAKTLTKPGFVVVFPYVSYSRHKVWTKNGFKTITPNRTKYSSLLYILDSGS